MDFNIPEELEMLRSVVRQFVETEAEPLSQEIEETGRIPDSLVQKAREIGLFGISIPHEYGGSELSMFGKTLVYEELGRTNLALSSLIGIHTSVGTLGLVKMGTPAQKERYLPALATGDKIAAFALTEPDAGSDAVNLQTAAKWRGDHWVINGLKHFITNGPIADVVTVAAVTDKSKRAKGGITSFIVEKGFPGFRIGALDRKMGLNGSLTSELIFEDCAVPAENVLGQVGEGYVNSLKILTDGRAVIAARCVGAAQKLLDLSIDYAKQRVQFGRPISDFQGIRWYLADMATEIESARLLTYRTAWLVDQGQITTKEAAMAKLSATEMLGRVADRALQIHGGAGYMKENQVERYYRDARIFRIVEGTSEIQRLIIASRLLA